MNVVYVIGLPGSGKTTMVERAVSMLMPGMLGTPVLDVPVPHVRYGGLWHIGKPRPDFGGTDTLSMSIQPKAIHWLSEIETECELLVGEGDRLANAGFLDACPNLTLVHLDTPLEYARWRATVRARGLNRPVQDESWWKGRATKVRNLVQWREVVTLDGTMPAYLLAEQFADVLSKAGSDSSQVAK